MNAQQRRNKKRKNIIYINNLLDGAISLSHLTLDDLVRLRDLTRKAYKLPPMNDYIFSDTAPCIPGEFFDNLNKNQKSLPNDIVKIMNDNMEELLKPIDF